MAIDFDTPGNADPFAQAENPTAEGGVDSRKFAGMFIDQTPGASPNAPGPEPDNFFGNAPSVFSEDGFPNERPSPLTTQEGQAEVPPQAPQQPYDPRNDPKRIEYHQSRADRYRNSLQQVEPYIPIVEYLQNDPEALQYLEQRAMQRQGGQPQGMPVAPVVPAPVTVPEAPKMPEKPVTYSVTDALTPGTESFKYREAMEQYALQRLDYVDKVMQQKDAQQREMLAQFQQQQRVNEALAGVRSTLAVQYKAPPELIEEFIQTGTDPRQVTLDNLWQLFMLRKQQLTATPQGQGQRVQQDRNSRQRIPVPIPGSGSPLPSRPRDPNTIFNAGVEKWDPQLQARKQRQRNQG